LKDYYRILGVSREAGIEDIKKAYRLKAKLYHPDINKSRDAKENFQLLNEAYHYLIGKDRTRNYRANDTDDPSLRRKYGNHYHQKQAYQYTPQPDKEQAKADELDKNFKIWGEKYGFLIFIILGIGYIFGAILDDSTHENYAYIFIILFGLFFIGLGIYFKVYISKHKLKVSAEKTQNIPKN
jgi:hypothetical protein